MRSACLWILLIAAGVGAGALGWEDWRTRMGGRLPATDRRPAPVRSARDPIEHRDQRLREMIQRLERVRRGEPRAERRPAQQDLYDQRRQAMEESAILRAMMERQQTILDRFDYACRQVGLDADLIYDDSRWPTEGFLSTQAGVPAYPGTVSILQIVGPEQMLVEFRIAGRKTVGMLHGYPTAGLVTERTLVLETPYQITGTMTYATALGGSNTVYILEPAALPTFDVPPQRPGA